MTGTSTETSKVYNSNKLDFTEDYMRFGRYILCVNKER